MTKNKLRQMATATMAGALAIGLASCRGATDNTGTLNVNETYASVGDFSVTYGDIWNELKWNSHEVLEEQITNVVLTKFINRIDIALAKNASDLTDSDKEALGFGEGNEYSQEAFEKLKTKYEKRLVDYVVQDGEIVIVDQFTGRLMKGRAYSEGLHQAIEAKENVTINQETKTLATITIQNYFRMYQKLLRKYKPLHPYLAPLLASVTKQATSP